MPVPAATTPSCPSFVRRTPAMFGAVFIGSTLVLTAAPAVAAPTPVTLAFTFDSVELPAGSAAPPNTLNVTNGGEEPVCPVALSVEASEYEAEKFNSALVPASNVPQPVGEVTGTVRADAEVTATLTYGPANPEAEPGQECADVDPAGHRTVTSDTWSIKVTEPEPSPTPTEEPTEEPSETPTEEPSQTPTEEPSETSSPTPTPTPTSSPTRTPTSSPTDGDDEESASSTPSDRASNTPSNPRTTPPSTPDRTPPRSNVPTSGADIPDLPRGEADLPELPPGSAEDLAELPLVTPSSDDEDTETEIAADHSDMGPSVTPAILLAAFLLALLLAAPLSPTRRVRLAVGGGYQGKRRKG